MQDTSRSPSTLMRDPWVARSILAILVLTIYVRFAASGIALSHTLLSYYYDLYYLPFVKGKLPWSGFSFEYPPLAVFFIFGFGFFSKAETLEQFILLKSTFTFLFLACSVGYFANFEIQTRGTWWRTLLCVLALNLMGTITAMTFDATVFCAILVGSACLLEGKAFRGSALLLASAFVKVVPVFAVPAFFVYLQKPDRKKLLFTFAALSLFCLAFVVAGWSGFLEALKYHGSRTIDMYSLWGAIDLCLQKAGVSQGLVEWKYSTNTMTGSVAQVFTKVSTLVVLVLFGVLYWNAHRAKDRSAAEKMVWLTIASTVIFVAFGKLGQVNYAIWVTACVGVLLVAFPASKVKEALSWILLLGYAVLSSVLLRRSPPFLTQSQTVADIAVAVLRSGMLLVLLGLMVSVWRNSVGMAKQEGRALVEA